MALSFSARAIAALAPVILAFIGTAAPASAMTPHGTWSYQVLRNGERIGTNTMAFTGSAADLKIQVRTRIAVKMMFVTVYRFEQDGREDWHDGRLVSISTTTNDDGKHHHLTLTRAADMVSGLSDGHPVQAPDDVPTGSLWDRNLIRSRAILNTITGNVMHVTVQNIGAGPVELANHQSKAAHHYRIAGDLQRDIWFDDDGEMVKLAFLGQDGSKVVYLVQ